MKEIYIDLDGQELTKEIYISGNIYYENKQGQPHRLDGPAWIWSDGSEYWYKDDKLHRLDGPAVIWSEGTIEYWLEGKRHRLDGPAVIGANGTEAYYLEGKSASKKEIDLIWLRKQVEE